MAIQDSNKISGANAAINLPRKSIKKDANKTPTLEYSPEEIQSNIVDCVDITKKTKNEKINSHKSKVSLFKSWFKSLILKKIPPFGTPEMYQPILHFSGKKKWRPFFPGERLAPVKLNFDGDWNLLNNKMNYRKDYFGHDKAAEVAKKQGACYLHTLNTKIDGVKYKVYQYWYYYAENPLLIDKHEHDLECVQVYVKKSGIPRWVFTSAHFSYHWYDDLKDIIKNDNNEASIFSDAIDIKWRGTHPKIFVAQNGHAMAANKKNFQFYDQCYEPYIFKGTMPEMIDLDNPDEKDNPFPGLQDRHGLIDKKGFLKNNGLLHNWFVRVPNLLTQKSFLEGAHKLVF